MTETAGENSRDARRASSQEPPDPDEGCDPSASRPRVDRRPDELTREEREFIRRYAEDFPPHHDSRWG